MKQRSFRGINALELKLLAMACMLCDHIWATLAFQAQWLTCVGRLAFPIFAFQIAEGYAHTRDLKAYRRRLLLWAALTEIPFNFMTGGGVLNPFHQNVLFTFWLSLIVMGWIERARKRGGVTAVLGSIACVGIGYALGFLGFVDYYGYGVFMTVMFCLFRRNKIEQFFMMAVVNVLWMKGLVYPVELFGHEWLIPQQAFAMLALIPIWLYNGEQGPYNKTIRTACYAFYPVHMVVLTVLAAFN